MSTWEIVIASTIFGLLNGGLAGLVWGFFIVWMGYCTVFASLAEMASMSVAPVPSTHAPTLTSIAGRRPPAGSTIGSASSRPEACKSF